MTLETSIKNALDGNAILFLGSGASYGAKNINNEILVTGEELAKRIYPDCTDLQQAVDLYLDEKKASNIDGELELIDFLKNQFSIKEITESQKIIPSIPWKRIYTTNYDNVVEKAYIAAGKNIRSLTITDNPKTVLSMDENICFHINGSIQNLTKTELNTSFKLSDYSYNTNLFVNDQWGNLFKLDLKTYSTIIFIGFSMKYDLDIKRIVNGINKDKIIFIVHENESEVNQKFLSKYGSVKAIGLEGFIDAVNMIKKSYKPIEKKKLDNTLLTNFEKITNEYSLKQPSAKAVLDYYKTGKRVKDLYYDHDGVYEALVKRSQIDKIIREINEGVEAIFLHSDIGNGKTEVVQQVCLELSSKYEKYILTDCNEKIAEEVELLCSSNQKKIIVIENFFNYYDVYKLFKLYNSKENIIFIFTARTSIFKSRIESFAEFKKVSEHDLNGLDKEEISNLVSIFNKYGFYPEKISNFEEYIKKICHSKLQYVVLDIFNNTNIQDSLKKIKADLENTKPQYIRILDFLMLVKTMTLDLNFEDALNLLNINFLEYDFERNIAINELLEFKGSKTTIKSVVLCIWFLKQTNPKRIINTLIAAAQEADKGFMVNKKYEIFLGNIISYRHLKFILNIFEISHNEKKELINYYYESIKNLIYYRDKYFFWLQYAISTLEMKDYEAAELRFNTAYNKLPSENQPFEIDNQFARLKMEVMLLDNYNYNSKTYTEICEINKLLSPTDAKNDDEFYCYKMSSSFYPRLFDKFFQVMNENEREGLHELAKINFNRCEQYINKINNPHIQKSAYQIKEIFLKLAFYSPQDNLYDFSINRISKNFAIGTIKKGAKHENASLHISNISDSYINEIDEVLSINQTIKVKLIRYNKKYNEWNVSMKI